MADTGHKWWLRYVVVPLIGSGGIVAIIVALLSRPEPARTDATDARNRNNPEVSMGTASPGSTKSGPVEVPHSDPGSDGGTKNPGKHFAQPAIIPKRSEINTQKIAEQYLASKVWNLRIVYGQNGNPNLPSTSASDDLALKFKKAATGYRVWRMNNDKSEGAGSEVTIKKGQHEGQWSLLFTREDLGDSGSGVDCKRAYANRGATFHLIFDSASATLEGGVNVARPDNKRPPYKCADIQTLPE